MASFWGDDQFMLTIIFIIWKFVMGALLLCAIYSLIFNTWDFKDMHQPPKSKSDNNSDDDIDILYYDDDDDD